MEGQLLNAETKSQEQAILRHLQSGRAITPIDALNLYKCFRLGARIGPSRKRVMRSSDKWSQCRLVKEWRLTGWWSNETL